MKYIEALEIYYPAPGETSIFLAGGITNCPDWQQEMIGLLSHVNLTLLNPRRADFPINDPNASSEQIKWEFEHLEKATMVLFWFPYETLCPIVLYELGKVSATEKPIFLGVHPDYQRRQDVEIQTALIRPDVKIMYSLQALSQQVISVNSQTTDYKLEGGDTDES